MEQFMHCFFVVERLICSFTVDFRLISNAINVQVRSGSLFDSYLNTNYASGVVTRTLGMFTSVYLFIYPCIPHCHYDPYDYYDFLIHNQLLFPLPFLPFQFTLLHHLIHRLLQSPNSREQFHILHTHLIHSDSIHYYRRESHNQQHLFFYYPR